MNLIVVYSSLFFEAIDESIRLVEMGLFMPKIGTLVVQFGPEKT